MFLKQFRKRITTNGVSGITNVINQPCSLTYIYISIAAPGTTWKFKIQDKSTPNPFVLVPEVTLSSPGLPDWKPEAYDEPVFMDGGVDVHTSGTPGEVALWINAWVNQ